MATMIDLDKIQVHEAMNPVVNTVSPTDKLDQVAELFRQHGFSAVAVVDEIGRCIGMITASDLIKYQFELADINSRVDQGLSFEASKRPSDGCIELVEHPFDEVQRHMTVDLQTIDRCGSLRLASKIMREQHIHHLIVLNESQRPEGILSTLDILSKLEG